MTPAAEGISPSGEALPLAGKYDRLLAAVAAVLNSIHGTDLSTRFWGILLYRYLCKCIRVHEERLPLPARPDYIDHDDALLEGKVGDTGAARSRQHRGGGSSFLKAGLRTLRAIEPVARIAANIRGGPQGGTLVAGFHDFDVIMRRLQPASRLAVQKGNWRPFAAPAQRQKLDDRCRAVSDPLVKLALQWLPACYVEEFDAIHRAIAVPPVSSAQLHVSFLSGIETRMTVAKHVRAGASLDIYQHSAGYGETRDHLLYHAEAALADRFNTWGWRLNGVDRPYLALRLIRRAAGVMRTAPPEDAAWVYLVGRQPTTTNLATTLAIQRRFFASLGDAAARRIVVRPRTNKGGSWRLQVPQEVVDRVGGVDDGKGPAAHAASNMGLAILDTFPTTSFMECLTRRVPVIAIVPPSASFTTLAGQFYEPFFSLGLLHKSPESAAEFLDRTPIAPWWRHVRAQAIVRDFEHIFCNCDETRLGA